VETIVAIPGQSRILINWLSGPNAAFCASQFAGGAADLDRSVVIRLEESASKTRIRTFGLRTAAWVGRSGPPVTEA